MAVNWTLLLVVIITNKRKDNLSVVYSLSRVSAATRPANRHPFLIKRTVVVRRSRNKISESEKVVIDSRTTHIVV